MVFPRALLTRSQAFVLAGGYENSSLWTDEGWRWKLYRKATHPVFWVPQQPLTHGAEGVDAAIAAEPFRLRQMTHETAMHWDWPVEVCVFDHCRSLSRLL